MINSKNPNSKTVIPKLSDKEFLILGLIVGRGEMFGLEMVENSDGQLKRGTIYVTLQRMLEKGLLESREEERPKPEIGISRKMYSTTGLGERIYQAQLAAVERFTLVWGEVL